MFTGVVLAVRATPKALDILDKAEEEKGGELSKTEIIADTWKVYIPAAAFCLVSVVCFIGSNAVNKNRCANIRTRCGRSSANRKNRRYTPRLFRRK